MRRRTARSEGSTAAGEARRSTHVLSIALPALLCLCPGLPAADDFYESRLKEGAQTYRQRRPADAAESLRIAAFGLLDRPPLLVEALARLALAQEAVGGTAEGRSTLDRFLEVERRFPAYREARLEASVRAEFDALLRRRVPVETLRALTVTRRPAPSPSPALPRVAPTPPPPAATSIPTSSPATRIPTSTPSPPDTRTPLPRSPSPAVGSTPPGAAPRLDPVRPNVTREEVDRLPQLRRGARPLYPAGALRARAGGIVLLRVLVSETGRALEVEVTRAIRQDLAEAAVAAVRGWTFEPAMRGARPVRTWTTVAVPFDPLRP